MENYPYPSYPDSGDSSPRSREIEFENPPPWDEQQPPPNYKAKFMCSYGGKIQPRNHDNQLSYIGGETKILAVDRHIKFPTFLSKLSALSDTPPEQLTLKYQLPGEELDALISVTNDDDLDHLMHEYDRLYRASSRPARMRLFLFTNATTNPNTSFSSDRDRFVEALNSGSVPAQPEPVKPSPVMHTNVDFLFGLDKPVPPVAAVKFHDPNPEPVAPQNEYQPRRAVMDRGTGFDPNPNPNPVEIQRQFQQMQIADSDQSVYRRRSEDGFAGDYYLQKLPEKVPLSNSPATVQHNEGYWQEKHFSGDGFPATVTAAPGGGDQQVYVISAPGTFYHAPVVRPPATQGYYAVQRMGSDGYREQALYGGVAPPPPQAAFSSVAPAGMASAQPARGSAYAEGYGVVRTAGVPDNAAAAAYAQVAYDSASGRQVYYNTPGGMVHAPPFQGVSPAISTDMRSTVVSSIQDGKVVNKVTQGSV